MISKKKLQKLYNEAKETEYGKKQYYTFESFCNDAKSYLRDIRKYNVVCSMEVSRSGMTRHFNTQHYNGLLNICYNGKLSYDPVKVGGYGMDMHWHLLFRTCEDLSTQKEMDKYSYNSKCSSQPIL